MKFTIKQIAAQAGVSKATVDRALHNRGAVHSRTQQRISLAIRDLDLQERSRLSSGRTLPIDVIMHTPVRFSRLVTHALVEEINRFTHFKIILRFHNYEEITSAGLQKLMMKCANDSYGIILKAENNQIISQSIEELQKYRVPVVTIVTDIPGSSRIRYVGMDNIRAGEAAAYLMSRWLINKSAAVAVVMSSKNFLGEKERVDGFCRALEKMEPGIKPVHISEGYGIDELTYEVMSKALADNHSLEAVYCVGGGNVAIRRAFEHAPRNITVYVGHDLDEENRNLLISGKMDAVIQHDLNADARDILQTLLTFHGFLPQIEQRNVYSNVNVITPYNIN
ncbi:LacI family DNA-binding transcriptional regulator [Pantoea agglomerans]